MTPKEKRSTRKGPPLTGISRRLISKAIFHLGFLESKRKDFSGKRSFPWRILRYQRIVDPSKQPYPLIPTTFVRPETFEKQMRYVATYYEPMRLDELLSDLEANKPISEKAVVVTFDGGWRDTYDYALPILNRLKIPGTAFLPTAFIGTMNMFWQDKIIASMLLLEEAGVTFPKLPFFEPPELSQQRKPDLTFGYSMARIMHVVDYLSTASQEERGICLSILGSGVDAIGGIPMERAFLSWDEVRDMTTKGFLFGSNSHGHRLYTECSQEEIEADISNSYQSFKNEQVSVLPVFSYPDFGISKNSREVLNRHGINFALGIGEYARPNLSRHGEAHILGRLGIYESVSYGIDLFAMRLWGVEAFGYSY